MQCIVFQDWPQARLVESADWLDCLHDQSQRAFYADWITHHECVLYLIQTDLGYSMGARYGIEKPEYLSPYGRQEKIRPHF